MSPLLFLFAQLLMFSLQEMISERRIWVVEWRMLSRIVDQRKPPEPNIKRAPFQYLEHFNVIKYETSRGMHNMYCISNIWPITPKSKLYILISRLKLLHPRSELFSIQSRSLGLRRPPAQIRFGSILYQIQLKTQFCINTIQNTIWYQIQLKIQFCIKYNSNTILKITQCNTTLHY